MTAEQLAPALYRWAQSRQYIAGGPWTQMSQSVRDRWLGYAQSILESAK